MAAKKTERVHIALDPDELKAIDDYRFDNRIPSRAEAIRALIKQALAANQRQGRQRS